MRAPKSRDTPKNRSLGAGRLRLLVGTGLFFSISFGGLMVTGKVREKEEPRQILVPSPPRPPRFAKKVDVSEFQKGNLHAHSSVSDGDVPPADVFKWYRDHGYNFVALTDHNTRVEPKVYTHLERTDFTILSGEEITMSGAGRQVHVNALCIDKAISGGAYDTARHALDHAVSEIEKEGGVALINHPNFDLGLTGEDITATRGAALLEVWSGHPYVWTLGTGGRPSHEAMWEQALSHGVDLAPAGVDDAHHFLPHVTGKKAARPGRAWIQVFGDTSNRAVICDRLRTGDLYASNGAELRRMIVDEDTMRVWPDAPLAKVEFLGQDGIVLSTRQPTAGEEASYTLSGDEAYVRARITAQDGKLAFTPAYRVVRSEAR